MTQALFRIGGVYRNGNESACVIIRALGDDVVAVGLASDESGEGLGCTWRLSDGVCIEAERNGGGSSGLHLIPGELHQFGGEWLPVEEKAEQPRAPYFAEAVEEKEAEPEPQLYGNMDAMVWAKEFCRMFPGHDEGLMLAWFANAIMTGFDEAQRRARNAVAPAAPPPVAQEATSHAPLAGLTVLMERDHRYGLTASKPS